MTTLILGASNIAALAYAVWQRQQAKAADAALADLYRAMTMRRFAA